MKQVVLFDLDGTVLDSKSGIFHSASYALERLGLPMPPITEMMAFLGPPLSEGFLRVCHVPQESVDEAVRLYRENYTLNNGMFDACIYDGVRELLIALREQGKRCYITTSKPQVYAKRILEHFDAVHLFDGVYGCELDGTRGHKSEVIAYCLAQENLNSNDAVLIGDRHFDVSGAKMFDIPCVGVLYGYGTREELVHAGAAFVAETTEDVYDFVMNM